MKLKIMQNLIMWGFQLLREISTEKKAGQFINLHLANKVASKNKIPVFLLKKINRTNGKN